MLQRILRGTAATISATFEVDGIATNPSPDSATVEVVRENGDVLIASGAATESGTGEFDRNLTATHTAELDRLTATWTATLGGQSQSIATEIEIVGAHLASLAEIVGALPSGLTPTADQLRDARTWAESWLEDACGVAFRPRYARERHDGEATSEILTERPLPIALIAVTVDDTALDAGELAEIEVYGSGILYRAAGWPTGRRNVEITYEHGFASVPAQVTRAATKLARLYLNPDPSNRDERASRIETDEASYSLITPGVRGAVTSIPEVNAVIDEFGYVSAR